MDQLCVVALALAAAMPQSTDPTVFPPPGRQCAKTYSASTSPLIADCEKALNKISAGDPPQICTAMFLPQKDIVTVGTCTVRTYSEEGNAHCLGGSNIRAGVRAVLDGCKKDTYTQGSYTWTPASAKRDGVSLIKLKRG